VTDYPAFRAALQAAGLELPPRLVADANPHGCKGGRYALTHNGRWGAYRSRGSGWLGWPALDDVEVEVALRRQERDKLAADEKRLREAARLKAVEMWSKAVEGQHPYLDRKGICSNGSRVLGEMLLVPVRDFDGHIHSVQMIAADGAKKFLPGGRVKGCCHWIRCGQQTGPVVYVCEGFATGSTIHAAMGGRPVVVAYNCGNLLPVCQELRRRLPTARIVVCADNDHATEGNPGLTHAREAATAAHARLAVPEGMTGTDFNDVQAELGIMEAKRQLMSTKVPLTVAKAEV
jgi:putative DNA primase/helicase